MAFLTKLDYSSNRQIKQHIETFTSLSGGTQFGVPFSQLPTGPNLQTSGISSTVITVGSTFSGNNTTTVFTWYDSGMALGEPYLSAITSGTSATTQTVNPVFTGSSFITIDGNTSATAYTGVSYDITVLSMV
jgi:hypothetical protein